MTILFDFDGTLANSFQLVMEQSNLLAKKHGFKALDEEEIKYLRDLPSREVIRYLGISYLSIPKLIFQMRKLLSDKMHQCPPVPGMNDVLQNAHAAGIPMGILTSNSSQNVNTWLEKQQLAHVFSFIHTESGFFTKNRLIRKTLKKYAINPASVYYVGDETRDIDAARKNQVKSIAVTWGYNSEIALIHSQPTNIVRAPGQLLSILLDANKVG